MKRYNYCVIGAGNGGIALAGHVALKGFSVNLYNRSIENIKNVRKTKQVKLTGAVEGTATLSEVSDNMETCLEGVDYILVTVPATGHRDIAKKMAPFLKEGQVIILNPGRTAGALEVYHLLKKETKLEHLVVGEAQSLIYACRAHSDTEAHIFQLKQQVSVATLPSNKQEVVMKGLEDIFPGIFFPTRNVWETGINNFGAVFHPGPTLLNMSRIENGETFKYYTEGITSGVSKILHKLDEERMEIGRALDVDVMSTLDWLYYTYGAKADTIEEAVKRVDAYLGIVNPDSMNVRYITEDIPCSLVPMESIAKELGIHTPIISSLIDMANVVSQKDYRELGRNVEKLGIKGLNAKEMVEYVNHGEKRE